MDAQEKEIYTSIILAAIIVAGAVGYFLYSVIRHHKRVLQLERASSKAQVELLEKDRARIAADLHDELAPMLVAVKMQINSFDLPDVKDRAQLGKTNDTIDDISRRMRSISFDLMPSTLLQKGLATAANEFVDHINLNSRVQVRLYVAEDIPALDPQQQVHIYRIVQEIIHNAIKHAEASELIMSLQMDDGELVLSAKDNGKGFHYKKAVASGGGLGLRSLQNRVHLLDAGWVVDSAPGRGTTISIRIPMTANEHTVFKDQRAGG